MPQFQPSVWIFVVFALLALAALAGIGFFIADRLQPVIMNALRSNDRLPSLQSRRRGARRRQGDDEPADDLDDSTQLVLSMLSLASVVVDDQDEVVRANPAAYRLGLVRDDTLIEPTLLDAVHKVMKDGSRCSFDLETQTPEQFMTMNGFDAAAADDGLTAEQKAQVESILQGAEQTRTYLGKIRAEVQTPLKYKTKKNDKTCRIVEN